MEIKLKFMDKKYYAIKSENLYVISLNLDGSLQIGGSLIKNMNSNKEYVQALYELILTETNHDVSFEEITIKIEELDSSL